MYNLSMNGNKIIKNEYKILLFTGSFLYHLEPTFISHSVGLIECIIFISFLVFSLLFYIK